MRYLGVRKSLNTALAFILKLYLFISGTSQATFRRQLGGTSLGEAQTAIWKSLISFDGTPNTVWASPFSFKKEEKSITAVSLELLGNYYLGFCLAPSVYGEHSSGYFLRCQLGVFVLFSLFVFKGFIQFFLFYLVLKALFILFLKAF